MIAGKPATRIDQVENVATVFKAGIDYDLQKLADSVRGLVGVR